MNAKKIMGAVLVALLAAALFVGAGAAADATGVNHGTVFIYQDVKESLGIADGLWTNNAGTISVVDGIVIPGANFVAGIYENGEDKMYVTYPTASYLATSTIGEGDAAVTYIVDGIVYLGNTVDLSVISASPSVSIAGVYISYQGGAPELKTDYASISADKKGTYTITAAFGPTNMSAGTPQTYKVDTVNSFTFKVVGADDVTITATADNVIVGQTFTVTVVGQPGVEYTLVYDKTMVTVPSGQPNELDENNKFVMPNTGSATIYIKAEYKEGTATIAVEDAEVDVEIEGGEITAAADKDSYYIGNDIELSGTVTLGSGILHAYIKGTNVPLAYIGEVEVDTAEKSWELTLEYKDITEATERELDAGTYTIYIATEGEEKTIEEIGTYATVSVALIQPFIAITSIPDVVIQGEQFEIKGTAEAATNGIRYYIFGTNYFVNGTQSVKNGEFTIKLTMEEAKAATGQYFVVIQHPMYDGNFNIAPFGSEIVLNTTSNAAVKGEGSVLFNVDARQTANAAQALCDALDTENIDDMYVKASFIVAGATSTINPIPSEIAQGSKLTVSGTTTGMAGDLVTVEMLSTAFAAVPKNTVGSASFISLTTKVADDGTWEVTFDTSSLNVDEYSLSVAVGDLDTTTTKVNVVEAADKPDTPVTPVDPVDPVDPVTPTEPETPGFGALAALAGLGAVAVLLLRRE